VGVVARSVARGVHLLRAVALGSIAGAVALACSNILGLRSIAYDEDASLPRDGPAPEVGSRFDGGTADVVAAPDAPPACDDAYYTAVIADQPAAYFRLSDAMGSRTCANEVLGSTYECFFSSSGLVHGAAGENCAHAVKLTDGSASVTMGNGAGALDFPGNVSFTIEAWVEVDAVDGGPVLPFTLAAALTAEADHAPDNGYDLTVSGGDGVGAPGPRAEMWIGGILNLYAQNDTNPSPSVPFFLVLVHDMTQGIDHLYVNGIDSPSEGFTGADASSDRPPTGLPLTWNGFVGTLGEVAIYETALTAGQIGHHYALGGM
jgi:hypothetical protein